VIALKNRTTKEELERLIDDKSRVEIMLETMKDINSYLNFASYSSIVNIPYTDLPFEKLMMYAWIKESIK
jgi:hypothetical protein